MESIKSSSLKRIEALKQYLADDPEDDFSQYALSLEYMQGENYLEAISNLENLLARNPEYLAAYYQLGKLYELQQRMEEAVAAYEKGLTVARAQHNIKTYNELRSALDLL